MLRRGFWSLALAVCLLAPVALQAQGGYLDVYVAKAKPEKMADLEAIATKMVDANRRFNGDRWLAMETMYGEGSTIVFVSSREDYADVDKASEAFMTALHKAYGKDGAEKMLHDWNNCLAGSHTELRRRRMDLSRKAPADAAAWAKFVGGSRVLRTTAVHIRPGHIADFEALLKETKAAGEQNPDTQPLLVSQVVEGSKGTTFYISALRPALGGFDKNPTTREILGEEGYKKFLQVSADSVEDSESMLYRYVPEISNPVEDIVAVAPDFWQPKATAATGRTPKGKSPSVQPAAQKQKQ